MRKQNVTFRLLAMPVHHHVDQVPGPNLDAAIGLAELFDRN
jgi:hypothetical protein